MLFFFSAQLIFQVSSIRSLCFEFLLFLYNLYVKKMKRQNLFNVQTLSLFNSLLQNGVKKYVNIIQKIYPTQVFFRVLNKYHEISFSTCGHISDQLVNLLCDPYHIAHRWCFFPLFLLSRQQQYLTVQESIFKLAHLHALTYFYQN